MALRHVDLKLVAAVKLHWAHVAAEELQVQMSALVISAVSVGDDALAAEFACGFSPVCLRRW
jgi:hypothetical protein